MNDLINRCSMKKDKKPNRFCQYDIEEDEYLRIARSFFLDRYILSFLIPHIFTFIAGCILILQLVNKPEIELKEFTNNIIVGVISLLVSVTFCIFWHKQLLSEIKYTLLFNKQGIKNVTDSGEVFIPWDKLVVYGKEQVRFNGRSSVIQTVVYFSTRELDYVALKKTVVHLSPEFYKNSTGSVVIALILPGENAEPELVEEMNRLYEKIDTYVKLHKIDP